MKVTDTDHGLTPSDTRAVRAMEQAEREDEGYAEYLAMMEEYGLIEEARSFSEWLENEMDRH